LQKSECDHSQAHQKVFAHHQIKDHKHALLKRKRA
jgi:hypothetical protein